MGRPHAPGIETVNDLDGFLANFFRSLRADPDAVAHWADWPVNEADQHAVHTWLVNQRQEFTARLMGDPDYYDAQVAGRWVWGLCCWIGSGWCSGKGPWHSVDGKLVRLGDAVQGVRRKLVHLGDAGRGVHRKLVRLGDAGQGVRRKLVRLGDAGQGVHRKLVHLGQQGAVMGVHAASARGDGLYAWFEALATRLRYVRVCCGDWTRVLGPSVTTGHGLTGILLDPPYGTEEDRTMDLYAEDSGEIAGAVRQWCLEHGNNPLLRIVFCGYGDAHDVLLAHGWQKTSWRPKGGFGSQGQGRGRANAHREMLWSSPACLPAGQMTLW